MERLTCLVGEKSATLPDGAATSIAAPLNRGGAELICSQALSTPIGVCREVRT